MTDPSDGFQRRTRIAAAGLRGSRRHGPAGPRGRWAPISKVTRVARVVIIIAALAAMGAVAFALATVADSGGAALGHGGHPAGPPGRDRVCCAPTPAVTPGWFPCRPWPWPWCGRSRCRPTPPAAGWWLVALSAIACAGGVLLAGTALRQRLGGTVVGLPPLRGTTRRGGDRAGAGGGGTSRRRELERRICERKPARRVRLCTCCGVRGVRLDVWSEVGTVPDHTMFDTEEDQP